MMKRNVVLEAPSTLHSSTQSLLSLATLAENRTGSPTDDNEVLFIIYFVAKRLLLLSS